MTNGLPKKEPTGKQVAWAFVRLTLGIGQMMGALVSAYFLFTYGTIDDLGSHSHMLVDDDQHCSFRPQDEQRAVKSEVLSQGGRLCGTVQAEV
jgi:hypothetical protein